MCKNIYWCMRIKFLRYIDKYIKSKKLKRKCLLLKPVICSKRHFYLQHRCIESNCFVLLHLQLYQLFFCLTLLPPSLIFQGYLCNVYSHSNLVFLNHSKINYNLTKKNVLVSLVKVLQFRIKEWSRLNK